MLSFLFNWERCEILEIRKFYCSNCLWLSQGCFSYGFVSWRCRMSGFVVQGPKSDYCDSSGLKNRLYPNNKLFSGGHYRVSAPGHLPLETMGYPGFRPPGDSLLVPGRWLPPHERCLLKAVEPIMDTYNCGIHLPVNIGRRTTAAWLHCFICKCCVGWDPWLLRLISGLAHYLSHAPPNRENGSCKYCCCEVFCLPKFVLPCSNFWACVWLSCAPWDPGWTL